MDFKSKVVLVTGGSSGLGLATTQAFLETGATVVVASRKEDKLAENMQPYPQDNLYFVATDFGVHKDIKQLFEKINDRFKKLDIAINNVGGGLMKPLLAYEDEEFDFVNQLNFKSIWQSMKYEIPLMLEDNQTTKHIINVSSVNGLGGLPHGSLYAANKAALLSLTKSAAMEYATSNISINAIVPGAFKTPMLRTALEIQAGGDLAATQAIENQYKQFIPKERFGRPEEFAETILWMCSGKVPYLSGHSLILDGGMTSRFR